MECIYISNNIQESIVYDVHCAVCIEILRYWVWDCFVLVYSYIVDVMKSCYKTTSKQYTNFTHHLSKRVDIRLQTVPVFSLCSIEVNTTLQWMNTMFVVLKTWFKVNVKMWNWNQKSENQSLAYKDIFSYGCWLWNGKNIKFQSRCECEE